MVPMLGRHAALQISGVALAFVGSYRISLNPHICSTLPISLASKRREMMRSHREALFASAHDKVSLLLRTLINDCVVLF